MSSGRVPLFAWGVCLLFVVSTAFPVYASIFGTMDLPWVSILDVAVAVTLVVSTLGMTARMQAVVPPAAVLEQTLRAVRIIAAVPLLLLAVFLLVGTCIAWDVLLAGLAWRFWLLMYACPSLVAALWVAPNGSRSAR